MAAFDQLRPEIQRFLVECPFEFNAEKALQMQIERGPRYTLDMLRRSLPLEIDRFQRERNDALVWAQRTFTNSPRKVRSKTLKLSFFELAEQAERGVNLDTYVTKRLKDAGAADPSRAIRFDDPSASQVVFTFTVGA